MTDDSETPPSRSSSGDPMEKPPDSLSTADSHADPSSASPNMSNDTPADHSSEPGDSSPTIEDLLLEFDDQEGLIRDRSLLDPNSVDHIDSRVILSDGGEPDRTGRGASPKRW